MIFFLFHSLICYFLSEFKMWCFSGQFIALSLQSVRAKYSRAIMVAYYFYPKVEAGKVSGFVCLSESVVQFVIDSLPPHLELQFLGWKLWSCGLLFWSCMESFSLCSAARHMPLTCLSLMEKELWHGVEAGSDSDFTGLLAVLWEMGQVWTGSRSPAQLVGVPAVVNGSVPALFLPHLECWLPSRPLCTWPCCGGSLESLWSRCSSGAVV